jgi:hypothetical protein
MVEGTGHQYGDIVVFVCDEGYQLLGNVTSVCAEDGLWSQPVPVCTIIRTYTYNTLILRE